MSSRFYNCNIIFFLIRFLIRNTVFSNSRKNIIEKSFVKFNEKFVPIIIYDSKISETE